MIEDLACRRRTAGRETAGASGPADGLPVPGGELGHGESIHGADHGDGNDRPIQATRFRSVMLPDEVQDDGVIRSIETVSVIVPTAGAEVDLDAACAKLSSVDQDERVAKIWPETVTPRSAVNDFEWNAV